MREKQLEGEPRLEEEANGILEEDARRLGVSLRKLGIVSFERERVIRRHEVPMSSYTNRGDETKDMDDA